MPKHYSIEEKAYEKGLLDSGKLTWREVQTKFNIKFGRMPGKSLLKRISKGIEKSRVRANPKPRITSSRDERIIQKVIKENRLES